MNEHFLSLVSFLIHILIKFITFSADDEEMNFYTREEDRRVAREG